MIDFLQFLVFFTFLYIPNAAYPAHYCNDNLDDLIPDLEFTSPGLPDSTPGQGRLNNAIGSWSIDLSVGPVRNVSLIVDLGSLYFVSAILWQGSHIVSDYSYRIGIEHAKTESNVESDWTEEDFLLVINSDDDENHITATNPSVWTVKPLRYLKVFIVEVVLHNGPVGGRLGLIGCEEFSPKVEGSLKAHYAGGASIAWTAPIYGVEIEGKTMTPSFNPDYFVLSWSHGPAGEPDFVTIVKNNHFNTKAMTLGIEYMFDLKCKYQGVDLQCGSWKGVAYPDCPDGWSKNVEYCYKSSGAANKMTRREALQGYNDTISGLMATYANDVPNQQFVLNHWPDALLLIMDKQCSLTGCCYGIFQSVSSSMEQSCESAVTDVSRIIIYVQYVPALVSNCTNIEISMAEDGSTVMTFEHDRSGWPTLMKVRVLDSSRNKIIDKQISKSITNISVVDLEFNSMHIFQCIPYMTDDWQFVPETDQFINIKKSNDQFGSFKPELLVSACNYGNGKVKLEWPVVMAKSIDAANNILNNPADSYDVRYTIINALDPNTSNSFMMYTDTFLTINSLKLSSAITGSISCVFGANSIPCAQIYILAEPPRVVRANESHIMAYELRRRKMNWWDSELDCQVCGGHLASIDSEENEKPLQELSDVREQFYVGITTCSGSSGKWTDGKFFNYIPENGHIIYKDKCCGSVSADLASLNIIWVDCKASHQHVCLTVVPKPNLVLDCVAVSTTEIHCVWELQGDFWTPSTYDLNCHDMSMNESNEIPVLNLTASSHTLDNLNVFTKYKCKISTAPKGYGLVFEDEQTLYSGYSYSVEWTIDLNGSLSISWPKFIAFGDAGQEYNISCGKNNSTADIFQVGTNLLDILVRGLLYGYTYTCHMQGTHEDGSTIQEIFNVKSVPSCDKGQVELENYCLSSSIGSSNETSKPTIFDISDVKKEDLVSIVNDPIIWINSSTDGCCSTSLEDLPKVTCTTDPKECSKDHTIIIAEENTPPFCQLRSVEVVRRAMEVDLVMERSDCWGNHYIKISYRRVPVSSGNRRKRETALTEVVTQNSTYTVGNLEPSTTYLMMVEPAMEDGTTSDDPAVKTSLTVTTLSEDDERRMNDPELALLQDVGDEPLIGLRISACSIVIICVGLTLVIYIHSRMFYQDTLCMMCSSICLIAAYVSILLSTVQIHHITYSMCLTMALFLHFFFLATFTFILLEFLSLSRILANIPRRDFLNNSWYIFATGWGVPAIIVAITVGVLHENYTTKDTCWIDIDGSAWLPVIIPISLIIVGSCFFVLILLQSHELDKDKMRIGEFERAKQCLSTRWATIAMLVITTITWVLGLLAENSSDQNLYVGFIIMSFMLGFCHMIFRCLAEVEVRNTIAGIFCCLYGTDSYRWGSYISSTRIRDMPDNQTMHGSIGKHLGSVSSIMSTESDLSTSSTFTGKSGVSLSRTDLNTSFVPSLRRTSLASLKPVGRLRPGTAAIKR